MKTILVPLDGSALAERVLPHVRLLAGILDARVHLLQVISDAQHERMPLDDPTMRAEAGAAAARMWERGQSLMWERLRQYAENYLDQQAASLRAGGLYVTVEAQIGAPVAAIIEVAAWRKANLIAMATHGYSGLKRWALGSVTDEVVHSASTPVFLVRGDVPAPADPLTLKRIVVPLDRTALARQALPLASELATAAQAELVVVQAVAPSIEEYIGATPPLADIRAALRDQALQEYDRCVGIAGDHASVTAAVMVGRAAEAIVNEVDRRHADLIVMATHAYSGLKRWVRGSVADQVLHATTTPLVLVRATVGEN